MDLKNLFLQTAKKNRGIYFNQNKSQSFKSYMELVEESKSFSVFIDFIIRRKNFIVVIWMDQTIEALCTFMAIKLAGGIPVPLHPFVTEKEFIRIVNHLEADLAIISNSKNQYVSLLANEIKSTKLLNGETYEILLDVDEQSMNQRSYTPPESVSVIIMSSGSTGIPKGIMLSDENLLSNATSISKYIQLNQDDKVLLSKSLGYCSTITGEWFTALIAGSDLQLSGGFRHPLQLVQYVLQYKTTFLCTVPSVLIPLIKSSKLDYLKESLLRKIVIVGGAMPPELLTALKKRLPNIQIITSYGLTEASPRVTYLPPEYLLTKPNSVGVPIEGVKLSLIHQGEEVPLFKEGEVVVYGPNVMIGYYGSNEESSLAPSHLGLHTSDIGYLDNEGFLYITGRKDNALNIGGHLVYPEKIEQILNNSTLVNEVGVTGIGDLIWGEKIVALVVPSIDKLDKSDIFQYCNEHLSSIQRPKEVFLCNEIPKTLTGKLDRRELKAFAEEFMK
jgi:long-chain acyl-CoA synthetase